ncbi:MAG: phage holin family protein [Actinomycetales bacterium]|nr:phage holin family protein [Actinomycetales bacterium]
MATAPKTTSTSPGATAPDDRSLFSLLRDLPGLLLELVRVEVEQVKREMARKLKNLGVGAALVVAALSLTTFFFGTLIAAAVFGLAEVMPAWAAALTVSGLLLVIIAVLLGIAVARFKKGSPPLPTETFDSIVEDANALKGAGRYDKR